MHRGCTLMSRLSVRRAAVLAFTVLVAITASGCVVRPQAAVPDLRYRDEIFTQTWTTSNVAYASPVSRHTGEAETLYADVYRPTGDSITNRPAVIWIHGGSFAGGNKTSPEIVDEATAFARKGYVSVSIAYRVSPIGGCTSITEECLMAIEDAQADAQTAVRWLRTHAADYGVDPDLISIAGTSAGAITALNVAFNPDTPLPGEWEGVSSRVTAAVSLSGAALPWTAANPGDSHVLLFHGTNDFVVPYAWAQSTYDAAIAAGRNAHLITWQGAGHVPYLAHRTQIIDLTTNFLYWMMGLHDAEQ